MAGVTQYPPPPAGVSCWICLEEGVDELGKPLVRDCSCRGDSAGYGHISCLAKYAEAKCKGDISKFVPAWKKCHCCHQDYRGQVSLDMVDEMMSCCERNYPGNPFILVEALLVKLSVLGNIEPITPSLYKECDDAGQKLVSVIDELKAHNPSLPKHLLMRQANAYLVLGELAGMKGKPSAMKYFEKYRDLSKAIGDDYGVKDAEAHIQEEECRRGLLPADINKLRAHYKDKIAETGEGSPETITAGIRLALELLVQMHVVEGERLLAKMVAISTQVHGSTHQETKFAEKNYHLAKERKVALPAKNTELYQFLGYTDSSKQSCTLQGPIATTTDRDASRESQLIVPAKHLILTTGTPVTAHGLKNAKSRHLNGKIGDLRSMDAKSGRFGVYFEGEGGSGKLVKGENLHILLDLPSE